MSGDVQNSAEEAANVHVPASQEGQPQHVKHEGYVFLQRPRSDPRRQGTLLGEHWLLLHSVTHQKVRLPAPVDIWQLTIDNDGFATLYDVGTDAELDACDLFKRHLVKQDGELHIMDPKCGIAKLAELQIRHKEVQLIVAVGPTRATHKISGCALGSPLPQGIRFLWSGICLYSVLCLKCYKGQASKWCYEGWKAWKTYLQELGVEGQLISSLRRGVSVVGGLIDGFAPDASFSTLALLHLLCRWGTCAPKKGGMRSPDNKEAAIVVLQALLKEAIGTRPVVIELDAEEFKDGTSM
jgi:hypothetical protein